MGQTELRAGATIELLDKSELHAEVDALKRFLRDLDPPPPTVIKATAELTTDGAGNLGGGSSGPGVRIYQTPLGYEAFVHRLRVLAVGYSPSAPLTTGNVFVSRNGPTLSTVEYFLPTSGTVAPVIVTDGSNAAVQLVSGETLVAYGSGLPDNLTIFVGLQLRLWKSKSAIIGIG